MPNTTPAPPLGAYVLTPSELEGLFREVAQIAWDCWGEDGCDTWERCATRAAAEMLGRLEAERTP